MAHRAHLPTLHTRAPEPAEEALLYDLVERSSHADDPAGGKRGPGVSPGWSTHRQVLVADDHIVGATLLRALPDAPALARLALAPEHRASPAPYAERLVAAACHLASQAQAPALRLFTSTRADWLVPSLEPNGFTHVRWIYRMLRPADAGSLLPARPVPGLTIRPLRPGEEPALLDALNLAWSDTWGYQPIRMDQLERDLDNGQREGMLLGLAANSPGERAEPGATWAGRQQLGLATHVERERIVSTCHAIWEPTETNPDGSPRAWISNVTTIPEWRQRGVARALLTAGLEHLLARGASSVGLGVDAGNEAPLALYYSVGFQVFSTHGIWERAIQPAA